MSAYYDSMRRRAQDEGTALVLRPVAPIAVPPASAATPVPASVATPVPAPVAMPVTSPVDAGAFDGLRQQLASRGNGKALQALVFAGCNGAESCSGFVRAFGRSLAHAGSRVLVADLARAFAGQGLELADAVRSAAALSTETLGRGCLAECGTATQHGEKEALLRSPEFCTWLENQRAAFDYVLFAAPPAVRFADALLLGRACDGVILLVQSEGTERTALTRAREQLERGGVDIVGAVLDGVRAEPPSLVRRYFGED